MIAIKGASIPALPYRKPGHSEEGNALFLILVAVALFAALSFVIVYSTRSGAGSTSEEKPRLVASQILNYSISVTTGLNRLIARGCRLDEINFEHEPFDGSDPKYLNPNSPDDFSCHVFHAQGGAVPYQIPPAEAQDIPPGKTADMQEYYYNLSHQVPGVGTDNLGTGTADSKDLMIIMPYVSLEVCRAFNKAINREYEAPPEDTNTLDIVGFAGGDIAAMGSSDIEDADGILHGQAAACIYAASLSGAATADDGYYFYNVIKLQ
ncbi:MAG TPA: hypothetical protein VFS88_03550 [Micavibrio sp.]|nr:hypothetical protein [Micavibrio sp.]